MHTIAEIVEVSVNSTGHSSGGKKRNPISPSGPISGKHEWSCRGTLEGENEVDVQFEPNCVSSGDEKNCITVANAKGNKRSKVVV